ncbi:MAG: ATP-binding cassette domain-containing protein [Deltaproteobacteria bacterium]|nr:ATP-binding cassette domain-containing protein [Deltaproteobacteria bacterium]MBW1960316.1 ATP-binding cassette domain-containing protein [Deltaproteobacteria bacterium]MBW1994390.1 ATP-binding cassette domain-containing protein [Deltaproteobacteria bacterium]MBW2150213.1 ATP-binding cassette domain-containing protein [Deltaproteobacteria bacterium]
MEEIILKTNNLCKYFYRSTGTISRHQVTIKAVDDVDITVEAGQIFAVIGESGCGKSTLGYTLTRIYTPTKGRIWFDAEDISYLQKSELKRIRRKMPMVFQDAGASLNPKHTVGDILSLPLKIHYSLSRTEIKERVKQLLEIVNLPQEMMTRYPGYLSGGEKQRVGIARALALNPRVIILDEPTSALDVSVQAKILRLLIDLRDRLRLTYILITHNLSLTKNMADRVMVMYLGKVIEAAETSAIFENPIHPYTKALLSAIPVVQEKERKLLPKEVILDGEIPSPANLPETCYFLSRCQEKKSLCKKAPCPELKEVEKDHFVRCHL